MSTVCDEDLAGVSEECGWCPKQGCHSPWGHSAPLLPQEMQRRALNPSLGTHLQGGPDTCCSPDCPCWHCQPLLTSGDSCVLHGNLAECLELCVLSCHYVERKPKLRPGPRGGGKQMYWVPSMCLCLGGTSQFNRSGEPIPGCGRAMSFFLKHTCAGDWGPGTFGCCW